MLQAFRGEKVLILHFLDINQGAWHRKVACESKKGFSEMIFMDKNLHRSKKRLTFADRKEKRLTRHEDSDRFEVGILSFLVCQEKT